MRSTQIRPHVQATVPATPPKLLSGLTKEQAKLIIQSAEQRKFRANRVIIRTGDPASNFFLLKQGRAKYYRVTKKGHEVVLSWLAKGESFGIGALLAAPSTYIGTVQTMDDCELLVWSRDNIQSLARANERLANNALHMVMHRLAAYTDRLVRLTTETAEDRLAHGLLQLGNRFGQVRPNGVELAITNEDLAGLANVSAFTASRQLKEWERQGIIQKSRGKVFIFSPERLLID